METYAKYLNHHFKEWDQEVKKELWKDYKS